MSKEKPPMIVTMDTDQLAALVRAEMKAVLAEQGGGRGADPVLTAEQAADFLQLPVNVLRKRARAGLIPSFKIGVLFRFRESELNAWMAEQPRAKKAS